MPPGDRKNGGLFLPDGFEAVVVADSIGPARHIAVNDNGDIYVKLTYNDPMHGKGGTVALRDADHDGKADIITYFGDYKDEGGLPAGMNIHNGYLYTSTVRYVLRNKLTPGELIPGSATEVIFSPASSARACRARPRFTSRRVLFRIEPERTLCQLRDTGGTRLPKGNVRTPGARKISLAPTGEFSPVKTTKSTTGKPRRNSHCERAR